MVDFSLTRGGLLYTLFRRAGLARGDRSDARRQAATLVAIAWLPLIALASLESFRGRPSIPLMVQVSVHVRTLLAVPLLIYGEHVLEWSSSRAFRLIERGQLVADPSDAEVVARSAGRLRDAWLPELLLLTVSLLLGQLLFWTSGGQAGLFGQGPRAAEPLSPPYVWYSLVSLPLSQFLLGRTFWRWFIWSRMLWQISRRELRLVPTHPDGAGGIAILEGPAIALTLVELALGGVLAANWTDELLTGEVTLAHLLSTFAIFVVLAELVALGPALFFCGHLIRTRHRGLHQYGELALCYTRDFQAKWVDPGIDSRERRAELLGTSDIQSLADLANSYRVVQGMRVVPFGRRPIALLAVAALVPMFPLIALEKSIWDILLTIGRAFLGGAP